MFTRSLNSAVPATRLNNGCTAPIAPACSAEILDTSGRASPFLAGSGFSSYQKYGEILNYELGYQCDGRASWPVGKTIAALQASTIWLDDGFIPPLSFPSLTSLARLNQAREALNEKLEAASDVVSEWTVAVDAKVFDSLPDGEWTYRLEDAVSVLFPFAASGNVAPFVSMYHAGDLVYTSFIDFVEWVFEETSSLLARRRYFRSLILSRLRSRKGLADTVGLFLSERSWYLHHSAHPPALPIKAEGRFAATTRRVCFRPLPA